MRCSRSYYTSAWLLLRRRMGRRLRMDGQERHHVGQAGPGDARGGTVRPIRFILAKAKTRREPLLLQIQSFKRERWCRLLQEEEKFLHHQLATVQQEVQDALHARSYSITAVLILRLMLCKECYVMQLGVVCCGVM